MKFLKNKSVDPAEVNGKLRELGTAELLQKVKAHTLLKRPDFDIRQMAGISGELASELAKYDRYVQEQAEILLKYDSYIDKEEKMADKMRRFEGMHIAGKLNYDEIKALSLEARQKLKRIAPETLGQASRISGVSPADISVLMVYLDKETV
jgi:tRNA uridine 5-carboxymethylaminomethyl modification enzyme